MHAKVSIYMIRYDVLLLQTCERPLLFIGM